MGLDNPLHIAFLVVILLLVFGARRLPEIGRSLGSGMREFKTSVTGEMHQSQPTLPASAQQQAPPAPVQVPAQPTAVAQPPVAQPPPQAPVAQPPTPQAPAAAPAQAPAEPVAAPAAPAEQPPAS
jgi:sec-independent protein translocase protein TatA